MVYSGTEFAWENEEFSRWEHMSPYGNREFLTTEEAHAKTGLSLRYLQQLLKDERLDGFKAGPVWFVYTDSLTAFVDQPRKRGPKGPHKKSHLHDLIE